MIKQFYNIKKQVLLRHLIAWLLIIIYYIIYTSVVGPFIVKSVWITLLLINYTFSYYALVLFIWPNILGKNKILFLILLIALIIFFCSFFYVQVHIITPWLGGFHPLKEMNLFDSTRNSLKIFCYIFFTSIGTYNNWASIDKVQEDIEIDKKIISTEFLFLKNQFHSHLTFNFLNFCYSRIYNVSSVTADSMEEFANMLRYSLKNNSDDPVSLEEEISYIENYISFKKKTDKNLKISFEYKKDLTDVFILPKSVATFIEFWFNSIFPNNSEDGAKIIIESKKNEVILTIDLNKSINTNSSYEIELEKFNQIFSSFYDDQYLLQTIDSDTSILFQLFLKKQDIKLNE